ncbi:MAG: chemotaxis protein CheB [bacterium]
MSNNNRKKYEAVVIGASAGGLNALQIILSTLSDKFSLPIIIAQHQHPRSKELLVKVLQGIGKIPVKEAIDKEKISPGVIYFAPADYHLMIEEDRSFALSMSEPVNFARPSIDVLFETAAEVYRNRLIGIILTGANSDGSAGLKRIKEYGGLAIVQDPKNAEVDSMPKAAIREAKPDFIVSLEKIGTLLNKLAKE